jgi:hypothetical protein
VKRINVPATMVVVSTLASLQIFPHSVVAQGKNQPQGTTPGPPVTQTRIDVKESCGPDCDRWVKNLTIESASQVTFRYSTDQPGAASAIWQISDKSFFPASQVSASRLSAPQAPHVIASGTLGQIPASGHVSTFDIDFAKFAPKSAPMTPLSYWVSIVTKNARNSPLGLNSAPVKIVYRRPSQKVVIFSGIPGGDKPSGPPRYAMSFVGFTCLETTSGPGDDETYMFGMSKSKTNSKGIGTFSSNVFTDVSDGTKKQQTVRLFTGALSEINDYMYVIGIGETDLSAEFLSYFPGDMWGRYQLDIALQSGLLQLQEYIELITTNPDHKGLLLGMKRFMREATEGIDYRTYGDEDYLGSEELQFTQAEIQQAVDYNGSKPVVKYLDYYGHGSHYRAEFHLRRVFE